MAAAAAATNAKSSENRIQVNLNLSISRPNSPAGSTADRPKLGQEDVSFDLSTLRKFNKNISEGKIDQAVKLMAEDVKWFAFDGRVIIGRAGCQELFEEQKKLGLRRRPLTEWILQPKGPDDDQDLASFVAQRIVQYEKPEGVPARLVQTVTLTRGQITQSVVEAAMWEPGLDPLELMLRFGSLRAAKNNDQAVVFLDANCKWGRMVIPEIFNPPPDLSAPSIEGPDLIKQLWVEQEKQEVTRSSQTDWEAAKPSTLTDATSDVGGPPDVFSRQIKVSGKGGASPRLWTQIARVVEGRITEVAHHEGAAAETRV